MAMKTVLCYGDSNTYGYNPANGLRYPPDVRWTGVLQKLLGDGYTVIEEGLNGRTTNCDDPAEPWKNGLSYLKPCLNSHKPVDIITVMLGTNDCKTIFHRTPKEIADGAEEIVKTAKSFLLEKQGYIPKIILVSPPAVGEKITKPTFQNDGGMNGAEKSCELPKYYEKTAQRQDCVFLNSTALFKVSEIDCEHLGAQTHREFAEKICKIIKNL